MKHPVTKYTRSHLQWQSRLICVSAVLVFFVLSAQAQQTITAAANPVLIPNGQVSGSTTITWKAAPDYAYSEIYLSVDNAEWSEFARGADGSKLAMFKLGSSYTFRMMVYQGQQGTPNVITTLTVTTKQGVALPPPQAGGGYSDSVDAVGDRGSDYRVAPIRNVRVDPGPRHIFIKFQGPPNQEPYVAIGRGAAIKKNGEWTFGDNLVGGGFVGLGTVTTAEKAKGEYTFASAHGTTFTDDGLDPGKTYYYIINVRDQSGRTYQDTGRFVMRQLATTVKVVWERVLVLDDSDDLSTGEIDFWFWANYGQPNAKFSQYYNGDADSGHGYDLNRSVLIENAPNALSLSASGRDDDSNALNHGFHEDGFPPVSGPGSSSAADENVAKDTFDLTQYGDNETVNFILNTTPRGNLQFTIFGHFEITRTTATANTSSNSEKTGSTSSPLTTPPPIKAQRRIVHTPGTTSATPRSICDSAQDARARNNPAAPGLEQTCLTIKKGEALANQDPLAIELRNQQPDDSARQGFDIGMAAADRQTSLGPGKEQTCAGLHTTAEQGGCRIAVLFSVDRNRNAQLAATGAQIAQADQVVADLRNAETDVFYRLGFDIATGIFGNPTLGARGNTATGPGSLGVRDALNAAGQRGFNASVKLHLSRKY